MTVDKIWNLHSTFPSREEAISVARLLLEKRLVACANIQDNIVSFYHWKGAIEEASETFLVVKTTQAHVKVVIETIKAHHSYSLPCIVAIPVELGYAPYLQWVDDETAS